MRLTIIHPCIGRRVNERYIRSWQMEPLCSAVLAGLTPKGISIRFYDDRMEEIPFSEETDLVAISVETYTAKRAYQIAALYRARGVPVVMGGFHATLAPDEVAEFADAVVVGEAEGTWPRLLEDFAAGKLQRRYSAEKRPSLAGMRPDRSIFQGKRYLPLMLVEAGRGCHFKCEFCAIQSYFKSTQTRRPAEEIIEELKRSKPSLVFFVDDNITSNMDEAKEFFRKLIPLKIRWVSQASINAAHDKEFLALIKKSGCQGVLVGFESLNPKVLKQMHKGFNLMGGGYETALKNFREFGIRLYPTFIVGYDRDTDETIDEVLRFSLRHRFYIAAFNHLTPFPGTPLYRRLEQDGRLLFERWWLDPDYRYGMVPFAPQGSNPEEVGKLCLAARRSFYSLNSTFLRSLDFKVNSNNLFMWWKFFGMNLMMRREVLQRESYPLGDEAYRGPEIKMPSRAAEDTKPSSSASFASSAVAF